MSKRYLHLAADGGLSVTQLPNDGREADWWMAKVLFEASRTTDTTTRFDPNVHTLEAIATGLDGHRPLAVLDEIEFSDLPSDRYFRDAWEWSD